MLKKVKSSILVLLMTSSSIGFADTNLQDDDLAWHFAYKQERYQLSDPQGDLSLVRRMETVTWRIFQFMTFRNENRMEHIKEIDQRAKAYYNDGSFANDLVAMYDKRELANRTALKIKKEKLEEERSDSEKDAFMANWLNKRIDLEGRVNPLKAEKINEALLEVIRQEANSGILPKVGTFHTWNNETRDPKSGNKLSHSIYTQPSKILMALSIGRTYHFMRTDKEQEVLSFLEKQPRNSVTIHELFRKSYRVNKGDVYLAILTIENILAFNWRIKDRNYLRSITSLRNINNYYNVEFGDKYGSWYHMFGLILFGYVKGSFKSNAIATIESWGSHILSHGKDESQEDLVNSTSGEIGSHLREDVENFDLNKVKHNSYTLNEEYYLNLNEDYGHRLYLVNSPEIQVKLKDLNRKKGIDVNRTWFHIKTKLELDSCQVRIVPFIRGSFRYERVYDLRNQSFKKHEVHKIRWRQGLRNKSEVPKGYKVVINNCSNTKKVFTGTTENLEKIISQYID